LVQYLYAIISKNFNTLKQRRLCKKHIQTFPTRYLNTSIVDVVTTAIILWQILLHREILKRCGLHSQVDGSSSAEGMSVKMSAQFHHCHWSRGQYCDVISGGCPGTAIGTDTPGEIRPVKEQISRLVDQGMAPSCTAAFTRALLNLTNIMHPLTL
jgi:hypothetical protein